MANVAIVHPQLSSGRSELMTLLTIDAFKEEYHFLLVLGGQVTPAPAERAVGHPIAYGESFNSLGANL